MFVGRRTLSGASVQVGTPTEATVETCTGVCRAAFVQEGGKYASKCATKSSDSHCAVLPLFNAPIKSNILASIDKPEFFKY